MQRQAILSSHGRVAIAAVQQNDFLVHFTSFYISPNTEDRIVEVGQWLDWMTLQGKHIVLRGDVNGSHPAWGPIFIGSKTSRWRALNRGEQIFYMLNVHDLELLNTSTSPPTYISHANSSHVSWINISTMSKNLHAVALKVMIHLQGLSDHVPLSWIFIKTLLPHLLRISLVSGLIARVMLIGGVFTGSFKITCLRIHLLWIFWLPLLRKWRIYFH